MIASRVFAKPGIAWALLAVSVLLNVVLVTTRSAAPVVAQAPAKTVKPAVAAAPAPAVPAGPDLATEEWKVVKTQVRHSFARTFGDAVPEDGDMVSAVYSRLFMWDIDLRKDLAAGDGVEVAYRWTEDDNVEVAVARLASKKLGKSFRAYRFQAPGDAFPSYWSEAGVEVPLQLKNSPLKTYDQITSLLKDRPNHKGMDFKVPVGTPVYAPQAGVVTRANWNWSGNGNCVEVQYGDGVVAKFLHLSENKVKAGDKVEAGQVIALTGNTGRSTAPHLHYQLEQGPKVLDPLDYHGTTRRTLDPAATARFEAVRAQLDGLLADRTAGL